MAAPDPDHERRVDAALMAHRAAGRTFHAGGVQSFVREQGAGVPVVLMHGLPTSSFLYRKLLNELAGHGLRGLAFDLVGLGLAERPNDFDYTFAGLGRFALAAVDALGLDDFHLVVHDAGGPIGFELAAAAPDRIRSLFLLDTIVAMDEVPFAMEIYARFGQRRHWSAVPPRWAFRRLFYAVGVEDRSAVPVEHVDAHLELLRGNDRGAAYLQIMANVRRGRQDFSSVVDTRRVPYPVGALWATGDRVLPLRRHGRRALDAIGLSALPTVPARHYLQEDQSPAIGRVIADFIGRQ